MTELEKKVFREVFVNKPIMFHSDDGLLKIRDFFEKFGVGYLDFQTGYTHNVIMLNDNLNAYYLHRFNISDRIYNFDLLLQDYKETIRRKKMGKSIYEEALEKIDIELDAWDRAEHLELVELVEEALEQAKEQEKLLELYRKLTTLKDEAISIVWNDAEYFGTEMEEEEKDLEKKIRELEK